MKNAKAWSLSLLTALLVAACGGGDPDVPGSGGPAGAPTTKGTFTSIVMFGDSLSDVGTYAPATSVTGNGQPPFFGGKFTTNSSTSTLWVENIAASLSLPITPAEVGFAGASQACPSQASPVPQIANSCTGYAQGGARVTDPIGIGHTTASGAPAALTVPVVKQIENHLARFSNFKDGDLVLVWAGNNDVFAQFGTFGATATQVQQQAAAGQITLDQANALLFNAQTVAQAGMKQAALELAGYVRSEILAKGGKYVAVVLISDIGDTPFGQSLSASARGVLTSLSEIFNLWLRDGLTSQPVRFIDAFTLLKDPYTNPAKYGLVNNQVPACDLAKINAALGTQLTSGYSLFCDVRSGAPTNGLRAGADATTWEFADEVHPSTGAHKIIGDLFRNELVSFGWL